MRFKVCVTVLLGVVNVIEGNVRSMDYLPRDLDQIFDKYHQRGDLKQYSGEPVFWNSVQEYMCKFAQSRPTMTDGEYHFLREKVREFMQPLFDAHLGRVKRQTAQPLPARRRRELRMLSRTERERYFNAVNALKNDRRLQPNIYDTLMNFHTGDNIARAHFGPAFPAWHRLYLWLYESFLRQHDPDVTVPFWASVLDNEMDDPTQSVIWSPAFFGNGIGEPVTGPFRNWRAINPATIFTRNIGNGPLYSYEGIEAILRRTRNRQILEPTAEPDSGLENQHALPHVFVGGSMNNLNDAVRDPIFYSHHAFVDQMWERFRFNQFFNGINPGTDYPYDENDPRFRPQHRPNETMGFFPNNPQLNIDYRNIVGYSNVFFQLVQYERVPTCPSCGGSIYLFCNARQRCQSMSIQQMNGRGLQQIGTVRRKRQATRPTETCPRTTLINDFQYRYLQPPTSPVPSPGSDADWVYVPFKIISKRTEEFKAFPQYELDGFSSNINNFVTKHNHIKKSSQYMSERCKRNFGPVNKIKIVSYGLNYNGYAEEYSLVDNRLGLSVTYGIIPIRRPGTYASEAIIAAFDSCGRVCRPYCRGSGSSMSPFAGAVRVTRDRPLHYGNNYAEATLNAWQIPSDDDCPSLDDDNIPVSFYCDYTEDWIWSSNNTTSARASTGRMSPSRSMSRSSRTGGRSMRRGFPSQRGSRGFTSSRRSSRRRPNSFGVSGVPFHGASSLHSLVPDILKDYSLKRKNGHIVGLLAAV